MRRWIIVAALAVAPALVAGTALATTGAAELPPNWHVHDGLVGLGAQHKGVGFFPTILGPDYLADPAACPDATDKAFLPQGRQDGQSLRAGVCMTSTRIVHLRTVPVGTAGPEGWASLTTPSEPGWVTYYRVTER